MKKKLTLVVTSVLLVAALVIGGTLAYFTDTDYADNTFTAGNVKIQLIEQQRSADKEKLEPFTNGHVLMPIVGSAQGEKDKFGQPVAANYIDKIVTIKNTGASNAWIRAYYAVPSALDDGFGEGFNAGMNVLHGNFGNYFADDGTLYTTYNRQWLWGSEAKPEHGGWNYFETTIDGVPYNVYYADYYKTVAPNEITEQFISGVYLDANIDMNDNGNYIDPRHPDADLSILKGTIHYPVYAVAVQDAGFANAADAVTAAFGADFNPWAVTE